MRPLFALPSTTRYTPPPIRTTAAEASAIAMPVAFESPYKEQPTEFLEVFFGLLGCVFFWLWSIVGTCVGNGKAWWRHLW